MATEQGEKGLENKMEDCRSCNQPLHVSFRKLKVLYLMEQEDVEVYECLTEYCDVSS